MITYIVSDAIENSGVKIRRKTEKSPALSTQSLRAVRFSEKINTYISSNFLGKKGWDYALHFLLDDNWLVSAYFHFFFITEWKIIEFYICRIFNKCHRMLWIHVKRQESRKIVLLNWLYKCIFRNRPASNRATKQRVKSVKYIWPFITWNLFVLH